MSDEVSFGIDIDASSGFNVLEDLERKTNEVDKLVQKKRREMLATLAKVAIATTAVIGIVRGAVKMLGLTMDPILDVILTMIVSFVGPMQLLAAALTSTGLGAIAGVALAAISIGVAITSATLAMQGIGDAKERIAGVEQSMAGFESLAQTFITGLR